MALRQSNKELPKWARAVSATYTSTNRIRLLTQGSTDFQRAARSTVSVESKLLLDDSYSTCNLQRRSTTVSTTDCYSVVLALLGSARHRSELSVL